MHLEVARRHFQPVPPQRQSVDGAGTVCSGGRLLQHDAGRAAQHSCAPAIAPAGLFDDDDSSLCLRTQPVPVAHTMLATMAPQANNRIARVNRKGRYHDAS